MKIVGKCFGWLLMSATICAPVTSVMAADDKDMSVETIKIKKDKILVKSSRSFMCISLFNKVKGKYVVAGQRCLRKKSIARYSVDLAREKPVVDIHLNSCKSDNCVSHLVFELDLLLYDAKGKLVVGDTNNDKQKMIAKKMFNDISRALIR